ncbi:TIGR03936 family radical SAM-associated protein, partial [bacterium]|nr:TIGR03936 family radical SAM-associated protein [bacterium]
GLQYRWHRPEMSTIECVLSRGDRRLSRVVEEVYRTNGGFDGWDEHFSYDRWANAINQEGLGVDHYQRSLERDDVLPWNHLNVTLNKDFLWKEYERSNEYEVVNNCLDGTCLKCGVCDFDEIKNRVEPSNPDLLEPAKTLTIHNEIFKYYFSFSKTGPTRFISHLETMTAIIRSLRRTHLPLVYSQGFHPHPKISMCAALPVGMESEMEYFQIDLSKKIDVDATLERINHNLPSGFKINEISERSIPEGRVSYLIFADLNVDDFNRKGEEIIQVQRKKGPKTVNLKEIVEGLAQIEPGVIRLTYREGMEGGAKPFEVVAALMGAPLADAKEVRIRKMVNR